jgi:cytidylate kinase
MIVRRFSQSDYLRNLSETIVALARHRSGVIVGRGGHLILDAHRTLRVRCFAPVEQRVAYIAERDGLTLDEARVKVARVDEERRAFYAKHFQCDITSPLGFDLLLNTGEMSLEECATTVSALFRARFGAAR